MKKLVSILVFLSVWIGLSAQNTPAFWNDIKQFKEIDKDNTPESDAVLLIGSSSFTMWKDVHDYFPDTKFINRGFGGSSLYDLNFYSTELLQPYKPKQILIYCGENDFAANQKLKPREVYNRFRHFYTEIRKYHPDVPVAFISIKLSPSRKHLWPRFTATNSIIQRFMDKSENAEYIDITKAMSTSYEQLYLEDQLHMNPAGYRIWAAQIAPYLN